MTDLETAIRDALHARADAIDPSLESLRGRRPRRWLPPAIAAALVIALALTVGVIVSRRSSNHAPAASGTAEFVGYTWRLVRIDDRQGRLDLPATTQAAVTFEPGGRMLGSDTVHALGARYRLVPGGYTPSGLSESGNGLAGPITSALKRTLGAVGSCFSSPQGDTKPPAIAPVRASVSGDKLVLDTSHGTLTLVRAGVVPDQSGPASATSTSS